MDEREGDTAARNNSKPFLYPSRLDRLWEIANMSPKMTRGSFTRQLEALSAITATEGLMPGRRVGSFSQQEKAIPPEQGTARTAKLFLVRRPPASPTHER